MKKFNSKEDELFDCKPEKDENVENMECDVGMWEYKIQSWFNEIKSRQLFFLFMYDNCLFLFNFYIIESHCVLQSILLQFCLTTCQQNRKINLLLPCRLARIPQFCLWLRERVRKISQCVQIHLLWQKMMRLNFWYSMTI